MDCSRNGCPAVSGYSKTNDIVHCTAASSGERDEIIFTVYTMTCVFLWQWLGYM